MWLRSLFIAESIATHYFKNIFRVSTICKDFVRISLAAIMLNRDAKLFLNRNDIRVCSSDINIELEQD